MAKVSVLKFDLKGKDYQVNVNCNSDGMFSANLPEEVYKSLHLREKISHPTLTALETEFKAAIDRYKTAETSQELFIGIRYKSCGKYQQRKDGSYMFGGHGSKYRLDVSFGGDCSALGFDFKVLIKETIDQVDTWYKAMLGKDHPHWDKEQNENPDKYYKREEFHDRGEYKMIPFSPAALESLQNASEKIRAASEMLFNFIEQDEQQLELTLTKQKLLA